MQQIIEFFKGIFATDKWPARWHCGEWSSFHGWLYIVSDLMIWLAYFLIPAIILEYFSRKKGTIKFTKVYLLFATFILLCGSTHFIDAAMFYVPMYRLNALVRLATAIVSLFTVYHLVKILPQAFNQKTNAELEMEIRKRMEAERKLAEANLNLESFVYIASHDLQEPLRKVRDYVWMLQNDSDDSGRSSKQIISKINASAVRMQRMVQDVLTLSTLNINSNLQEVDLNKIIANALLELETKIEEKNAEIAISAIPNVKGNAPYLTQVFINLLSNAIKFCTKVPIISIYGSVVGDKVLISVADNGIGMETENLDTIFNTFQRLNDRTAYEGSGIGLAICKKIIDLHNGTITVESRRDEGSTFTIELPAA